MFPMFLVSLLLAPVRLFDTFSNVLVSQWPPSGKAVQSSRALKHKFYV